MGVRINGALSKTREHILWLSSGRFAARPETFERWRLRLPSVEPLLYEGRTYFPLDAVPNLSYQLNRTKKELLLEGRANVFLAAPSLAPVPTTTSGRKVSPAAREPPPSSPISGDKRRAEIAPLDGGQPDAAARELLLSVRINGIPTATREQILWLGTSRFAALPEAFERWHIPLPAVEPLRHKNRAYIPLDAVLNLSYWLDKTHKELLLEAGPSVFRPMSSSASPAPAAREVVLEVSINGAPTGTSEHILRLDTDRLAATPDAFARWHIRVPWTAPVRHRGEDYFLLDDVDGLFYRIDLTSQELHLEGHSAVFLPTVIDYKPAAAVQPTRASPGGFLNYDLSSLSSATSTNTSGLLELGGFNRLGVGTSTFLWRDFGDKKGWTRLETTWTQDRPDAMSRLRLGDTIGRAGAWGRSVRFGGLQWGTRFETQPGFIPFPLPGTKGEAALPSTLDVYVNNALRLRRNIPPGPFEIPNLPVVTGQGQIQLVVQDLLGRQQVISQPYYASPALLRRGLSDYSYEFGFVRQNFSLTDDDYGAALATATHRLGITDRFTREYRAEVLSDQQTAGISGAYLWLPLGTVSASLAASRGPDGNGGLLSLGFDRQSNRFSVGLQGSVSSSQFSQLGLVSGMPRPHQTFIARAGYGSGDIGWFSLSHTYRSFWEQEQDRLISASYSQRLGKDYFFSVLAIEDRSDSGTSYSVGFTITRPLGPRTSASTSLVHQTAGDSVMAQVHRSLPEGPGFGYRLQTQGGTNGRSEAGGYMQTDVGRYSAEAAQSAGDATSYRLGASGGVAFLGGVFPTRRIDNSFAVVKVGEFPDVRIYRDNQPVGRTDAQGRAMIPNLRAYEPNSVSIEPSDLPLDAQVDALRLQVAPYFRSGAVAEFPVTAVQGGTITLVLEDGSYLPPGAVVRIVGQPGEFPVAYRGEAYLHGLGNVNELQVTWKEQECRISVEVSPGSGPLPHLGRFVCKGVKP